MNSDRWNDLQKRYAAMEDLELQRLRATYDDLTPEGQDVLKREMDTRGLAWDGPSASASPKPEAPDLSAYTREDRRRILATGGTPLDIPHDQSGFAAWLFEKYGVEYGTRALSEYSTALTVAPADVERAYEIFSNASEGDQSQYEEWSSIEPEPIACPACGSDDVMVDSIDADGTSQWLCNACDHRWSDADITLDKDL